MSAEFDKIALLALPGNKPDVSPEAGFLSWSRPYLIDQIRQNGVDVIASRGVKSFDEQSALVHDVVAPIYDSEDSVQLSAVGTIHLDEVAVVRSIVRPIHAETVTPFLNPNVIRALARNKFEVASSVLQPSDVYHRQVIAAHNAASGEVADRVAALSGDTVVAKPINGQRSNGVVVGEKPEVITMLSTTDQPYMIEEKLDFSQPFPELRAINQSEQARLDYANASGVNKELRMYYFGDGQWDAVGRVAKVGEVDFRGDEWLYLDLESIPDSVLRGGTEVVRRLSQIVGNDEFNIALDWVYAGSASRPDATWQVMELNAAEPQLVRIDQNVEVGRRQHQKLAKQISRIALS